MIPGALLGFLADESGPTAVEYAVLLALIIVATVGAIGAVGNTATGIWAQNLQKISQATGGGGELIGRGRARGRPDRSVAVKWGFAPNARRSA